MQDPVDNSESDPIESATAPVEEWIAVGDAPVVVGRSRQATVCLRSPTVSRTHATLRRSDGAIAIEDHDSTYGTFVNGSRIRKLLVQPGDRVRFGTLLTYRAQDAGLRREHATGMSLAVEGLAVTRDGKRIVRDVDFQVAPDAFVGILGPSGSGKSTVLGSMATYLRPGHGRILYDDQHDVTEKQDEFRAAMRHVPQDDALFLALTVYENLSFAARLRLDMGSHARSQLNSEVKRVIELVGLKDHVDKRAAVLSGGQRKRLSVAIELLRRPRLLLLDEPTAGLDPGTEAHLMEHLRHISRQGTTVLCTTHLMHKIGLFDAVIVLGMLDGTGRVAYSGPPGALLEHFGCTNFADLYDRLEAGRFTPFRDARAADADSSLRGTSAALLVGHSPLPPAADRGSSSHSVVLSARRSIAELASRALAADAVHQCVNLCERTGRLVGRDRKLLGTMLAQPLLLGLLICLTQYNASRVTPILFFSIVIAIWLGLNNSARELVRERKLYIRDRLAGLRPVAYLGSKWLVHTAIGVAQLILLLAVVRSLGPLLLAEPQADDLRAVSWFWLFSVLLACYTGALGMGLLLSALVNSQETAVAFLPLLILPQLLVSAVGTLQVEEALHSSRDAQPFRPLALKLRSPDSLPATAAVVDLLSLACFSRPAILLVANPAAPREAGAGFWIADFCHLVILVLGTWTMTFLVFHWAEQRWTCLIGVG